MKKILTLLAGMGCLLLFTVLTVNGQPWVPVGGIHIYNPNNAGNGFVGIGTNAAPGKLLDVYRNTTEPTIRVFNLGGPGGATFEMTDAVSGANWKFKATNAGGFKIRDNAFGLDVITVAPNSAANSINIAGGTGDVGLGTNLPVEKLHVAGAINLGNTPNNNPGTIRWNGVNFQGQNGVGWVNLDFTYNDPLFTQPNIPFGNPEFVSGPQPMSLTFAFPGVPNPLARLYVTDMSAPPLFPHQLALETITGGAGALNASQLYRISQGINPPFIDYSVGLFGGDGTYKVCFSSVLTPTAQSDNTTMVRAHPSGIIDFANQSRVRAYQVGFPFQLILPGIWTPVNFTNIAPLSQGYDEQNEFTTAGSANLPTPPENSFFVAQEEGYYQVNARCEFNTDQYEPDANHPEWPGGLVQVGQDSYVSIAIYTGPNPGGTFPAAQGNNLQIGFMYTNNQALLIYDPLGEPPYQIDNIYFDEIGMLRNNNAPNVSDVLYLMAGQVISIWVFHTAATPMNLIQGPEKLYVSIHKVS